MPELTRDETKLLIKDTVKTSILNFAKTKIKSSTNFQILDLLIPNERRIRSIVGGLETSLGTTLWEPLTKALAKKNGFEVVNNKLQCPANMPAALGNTLSMIIEDRLKHGGGYNAQTSKNEIIQRCQTFVDNPIDRFIDPPRGHGIDIWLKKDDINYFFDTKTVQPNIPALRGCLEQVLYWYAYYYSRFPKGNAEARIVFPYNPYNDRIFWDCIINRGQPLEANQEAWVEDSFWNFCSGHENTFDLIKDSFINLRDSGELQSALYSLFNSNSINNE